MPTTDTNRITTDIAVIGAGHAGIEAAAAAARLGCRVLVVTHQLDAVGRMSCNPSIGGLAKGQLVREIDAMGGLMGHIADATGVQFRTLNSSKGPAVQAPRAQCDRTAYAAEAGRQLRAVPGVTLLESEVERLTLERPAATGRGSTETGAEWRVTGLILADGRKIACGAAILCAGTFMRGLLHCGDRQTPGGRHGAPPATGISAMLLELGFDLRRLKTGTSARVDAGTIDFSMMEPQPGETPATPFSFATDPVTFAPRQLDCYLTRTTPATHAIIRENLHRAPMFSGVIEGTGPRYCPSIEDKVVRFARRDSHQVFVEPEGHDTNVTYLGGISSSLPADVQEPMLRTIPGLERVRVLRPGYAVEYDFLPAAQVDRGLMTWRIGGLFLAGQILGTSGYEEAGAQGLMAGANAAMWLGGCETPFSLARNQAYIGVMIDDLITKVPVEPYRMFTSRAEHRLLLRADNADRRLTPLAAAAGLAGERRREAVAALEAEIARATDVLTGTRQGGISLMDELRRPETDMDLLIEREPALQALAVSARARRQLAIDAKYAGYLRIQQAAVQRQQTLEQMPLPHDLDYTAVRNMRSEAREHLTRIRPDSVGQAQRIAGVNPADIAQLLLHLATA